MKKIIVVNDVNIGGGAEEVFKMHINIINHKYNVIKYIGREKFAKPNIFQRFFNFHFFINFLIFLKKNKPDIIHIHSFNVLLSPSIFFSIKLYKLFSNKKIKTFLTVHDFYIICPSSIMLYFVKNKSYKLKKPLNFWQFIFYKLHPSSHIISIYIKIRWFVNIKLFNTLNVFDKFIVPSNFMKEMLSQKINLDKIILIRNPISFEIIEPINLYKKNNNNKIKLIYLGRLSMEKGLIEFLDLLKEVKDVDFSLDIFGTGPSYNSIKNKINALQLTNQITLKGWVSHSEISTFLNQYDVLILPSICYENAPLVIIEAFIKRINILTCDYGGMLELGNLVKNSFFFNYDSKSDLNLIFSQIKRHVDENNFIFDNYNEIKEIFLPDLYLKKIDLLYN